MDVEELRIDRPDGARIAVQRWRGLDAVPVLLLHGAATSSAMWAPGFVAQLARNRPVLLLDLRDAGRSSRSAGERADYSADDLVEDALAAIRTTASAAHVIGLSMGGGIAQRLAIRHPEAVASLTMWSTTPIAPQPGLPPMDESLFEEPAMPEGLTGRAAAIARTVAGETLWLGDAADEPELTAAALRVFERADDPEAAERQFTVAEPEPPADLAGIRCPVLVLHGDADRAFPLPHGRALAEATGGRLVVLEGVGHGFPPPRWWPEVLDALEPHLAG